MATAGRMYNCIIEATWFASSLVTPVNSHAMRMWLFQKSVLGVNV
jgi:hypothetical protein